MKSESETRIAHLGGQRALSSDRYPHTTSVQPCNFGDKFASPQVGGPTSLFQGPAAGNWEHDITHVFVFSCRAAEKIGSACFPCNTWCRARSPSLTFIIYILSISQESFSEVNRNVLNSEKKCLPRLWVRSYLYHTNIVVPNVRTSCSPARKSLRRRVCGSS